MWLQDVGNRGWVVLTKDKKIGRNELELKAIACANVKVFSLAAGNLRSQQMADTFVNGLTALERFARGNQAPFVAKIYKGGRVELWRNHTQLLKLLK